MSNSNAGSVENNLLLGVNSIFPSNASIDQLLERTGLNSPLKDDEENSQLLEWRYIKHKGKLGERRSLLKDPAVARVISGFPPAREIHRLYKPGPILQRSTLQAEVEWLFLVLEANKIAISKYSEIRNLIDESLFRGDYKEAKSALDLLVKKFGWSFAALERHTMLLAEFDEDEELSQLFNELSESEAHPLQLFVTAAYIYKANQVVSAAYFDKLSENNLKLVRAPKPVNDLLRLLIQSPDHIRDVTEDDFLMWPPLKFWSRRSEKIRGFIYAG